jgi:hypothetical protein
VPTSAGKSIDTMMEDSNVQFPATLSTGKSIDTALEEAAVNINERFEAGTKIALVNFSSPTDEFSKYVRDELSNSLVNKKKLVIVDRGETELILHELDFQFSGQVSDESMQSIGKMLGAQVVVSGSFSRTGAVYYLGFRALNVEGAAVDAQYKSDIANDRRLGSLLQGLPVPPPVAPAPAQLAAAPKPVAPPVAPPKPAALPVTPAPTPVPAGLEYKVEARGTVTITKYSRTAATVAIPGTVEGKPVTSIGDSAFYGCSGLTNVSLPAGIISIGNMAFYGCSGLTNVTLPAGITSIGSMALRGCSELQTVVFGGNDVAINSVFSFPYGGTSLKTAYETGKTGSNKGMAGTYKRSATGDYAGSWARQ